MCGLGVRQNDDRKVHAVAFSRYTTLVGHVAGGQGRIGCRGSWSPMTVRYQPAGQSACHLFLVDRATTCVMVRTSTGVICWDSPAASLARAPALSLSASPQWAGAHCSCIVLPSAVRRYTWAAAPPARSCLDSKASAVARSAERLGLAGLPGTAADLVAPFLSVSQMGHSFRERAPYNSVRTLAGRIVCWAAAGAGSIPATTACAGLCSGQLTVARSYRWSSQMAESGIVRTAAACSSVPSTHPDERRCRQ